MAGPRTAKSTALFDKSIDQALRSPPGTPVHVSLAATGDRVRLVVADDGPGLAPEVAARVFERFYRGDPARTRARGGSGLGLSIVAAVAEAHGGRVSVDTAPGAGARFVVDLPLAQEQRISTSVASGT